MPRGLRLIFRRRRSTPTLACKLVPAAGKEKFDVQPTGRPDRSPRRLHCDVSILVKSNRASQPARGAAGEEIPKHPQLPFRPQTWTRLPGSCSQARDGPWRRDEGTTAKRMFHQRSFHDTKKKNESVFACLFPASRDGRIWFRAPPNVVRGGLDTCSLACRGSMGPVPGPDVGRSETYKCK